MFTNPIVFSQMSTTTMTQTTVVSLSVPRVNPTCQKELDTVIYEPECTHRAVFQDRPHIVTRTSLGKSGSAKVRPDVACRAATPHTIWCGEDSAVAIEVQSSSGVAIIGLAEFDGHGRSPLVSRTCAKHFEESIMVDADVLVAAAEARDSNMLTNIVSRWMEEMEQITQPFIGGSTASFGVLVKGILIVNNLGDSPFTVMDHTRHTISIVSTDHGWDNPKAYQKYLDHCLADGVEPSEAIYGRINCWNSRIHLPAPMHKPIPIYKKGTSDIDTVTRDRFLAAMHQGFSVNYGGSQGNQRFFMERENESGEFVPCGEMKDFGHLNWGSTGLHRDSMTGGIQVLGSIGDRDEKEHLHIFTKGDVAIWELPEGDYTLAVFSDGIADQDYYHKYMEAIEKTKAAHKIATIIARKMFGRTHLCTVVSGQNIADTIRDHAMSKGSCKSGRPTWDDISVAVAAVHVLH